jgi:hypothetical protein
VSQPPASKFAPQTDLSPAGQRVATPASPRGRVARRRAAIVGAVGCAAALIATGAGASPALTATGVVRGARPLVPATTNAISAVATDPPSAPGVANTAQTAYVATGQQITHAGICYWRVRAQLCNTDTGPWSGTRSFASELPPQVNLNSIPSRVQYGTRVTIAGQLVANGNPVARPTLIVERRLYPSSTYSPVGQVIGSDTGRFAFSLLMTRSADWRLRWTGPLPIDQGTAPFDVSVVPRVSFVLSRTKVVRHAAFVASGFVYPLRPAWIQRSTSTGWANLVRVPRKSRFSVRLRANLNTGTQHLRLYAPIDAAHVMDAAASASRSLFVYDVIVIKP